MTKKAWKKVLCVGIACWMVMAVGLTTPAYAADDDCDYGSMFAPFTFFCPDDDPND